MSGRNRRDRGGYFATVMDSPLIRQPRRRLRRRSSRGKAGLELDGTRGDARLVEDRSLEVPVRRVRGQLHDVLAFRRAQSDPHPSLGEELPARLPLAGKRGGRKCRSRPFFPRFRGAPTTSQKHRGSRVPLRDTLSKRSGSRLRICESRWDLEGFTLMPVEQPARPSRSRRDTVASRTSAGHQSSGGIPSIAQTRLDDSERPRQESRRGRR